MPLKTILVVEDDALVRFVTVALIEDAGYSALQAADADEAIKILEARPDIHVVVTDVNMPGTMDGIKLAHYVKGRWPPIHILVVSGNPLEGPLPLSGRFLPKPFGGNELAAELKMFN